MLLVTAVTISSCVLRGPEDFKCALKLPSKEKIQRKFGTLEAHLYSAVSLSQLVS